MVLKEKKKMGIVKLMERCVGFFDDVAEMMISPEVAFKKILDKNAALKGIYVFIFFSAFVGIMIGSMIAGVIKNAFLPILFAVIAIIWGLFKLLIWSGITHIIAKFVFKGEGSFVRLFGLLGYTSVASILLIFGIMTFMLATTFLASVLLLVLMDLWILIIATIAVDVEHKIGIGKSFLSCCGIPALILMAIFLIMEVL